MTSNSMVVEEEGPVIYHSLENTRIYLEKEVAGLAIREVVSVCMRES